MVPDFIFAQDVILDPDTGKIVALVRNGEVFRDGARIAVLIGARIFDLNGILLGQLAVGAGSSPISFKNLLEDKSALRPYEAMPRPQPSERPPPPRAEPMPRRLGGGPQRPS